MDGLDRELQKRVWQRVQSREGGEMPPLGQDNLRPWLTLAQENAAAYQSLSRQFTGREAERLRRLYQQSQSCAAGILGVCRLRGEQVRQGNFQPPKEPPRKTLEKCYHRERRLWEGLRQMLTDGEYGLVFDRLAQGAQERSLLVAELLGRLV